MNLLLDTHILIWALNDDPRLPQKAKDLIMNEDNTIFYSPVSIWEVSIKHAIHPDKVRFTGKELAQFCEDAGYISVELHDSHVFALETLMRSNDAPQHNDPFDRMLIAQAKAEHMSFVTHDSLLPYYNEKCIVWV